MDDRDDHQQQSGADRGDDTGGFAAAAADVLRPGQASLFEPGNLGARGLELQTGLLEALFVGPSHGSVVEQSAKLAQNTAHDDTTEIRFEVFTIWPSIGSPSGRF